MINDTPTSLVDLLTYLFGYLRGSRRCQWFGVNMGCSDEDRILMKNLYIFKVVEQKNLLWNFRIKVGDGED